MVFHLERFWDASAPAARVGSWAVSYTSRGWNRGVSTLPSTTTRTGRTTSAASAPPSAQRMPTILQTRNRKVKSSMEKVVRILNSFEEADHADKEYYLSLSPEERLQILI